MSWGREVDGRAARDVVDLGFHRRIWLLVNSAVARHDRPEVLRLLTFLYVGVKQSVVIATADRLLSKAHPIWAVEDDDGYDD